MNICHRIFLLRLASIIFCMFGVQSHAQINQGTNALTQVTISDYKGKVSVRAYTDRTAIKKVKRLSQISIEIEGVVYKLLMTKDQGEFKRLVETELASRFGAVSLITRYHNPGQNH